MAGKPKTKARKAHNKRKTFKKKPLIKTLGPFKRYSAHDPIGPSKVCKLTYTAYSGLQTNIVGAISTWFGMNLNSIFSPENAGTGAQPYYHDQMALLYNRYKVNGCKVDIVFQNPSEDGMQVVAAIQPSVGLTSYVGLTVQAVQERPMTVCRAMSNTGEQVTRISQYFSIGQVEGLSPIQFKSANSDVYCANLGSNPTAMPTLWVGCSSNNGTSGATVQCNITITYYVRLYERIQQARS